MKKGFTILELLVVVAIIAILAIIALPNFIGKIDTAKESQNLAEINAVTKAVSTYYSENGKYPTLQGNDSSLLQLQPVAGSPHNVDFSKLVPNYLTSLPHFSYWWVDYQGKVYHTAGTIGSVASGGVFTPVPGNTYYLNSSTAALTGTVTLGVNDYITGKDSNGVELPMLQSNFKGAKMHPEDPEYKEAPAVGAGNFIGKDSYTTLTNNNGVYTLAITGGTWTGGNVTLPENYKGVSSVTVELDYTAGAQYGTAYGTYFGFKATTSNYESYYYAPKNPSILVATESYRKTVFIYDGGSLSNATNFVYTPGTTYRIKIVGDIKNSGFTLYVDGTQICYTSYAYTSLADIKFVFGKGNYGTVSTDVFKNITVSVVN